MDQSIKNDKNPNEKLIDDQEELSNIDREPKMLNKIVSTLNQNEVALTSSSANDSVSHSKKVGFNNDTNSVDIGPKAKHMLGDLNMSANPIFLLQVIIFLNLPGFLVGYGIAYQNQLTPCFETKFNWKGTEADLHNAFLGGSVILGMTIGALIGGVLMQIGRRKSMFICLLLGVSGNFISMNIQNFKLLIFGRFLFGLTSGLYTTMIPKMLEETIPNHHFASAIATWCLSQSFAISTAFLMGSILPEDSDEAALKETDLWLVFYIYVPVGMELIFLMALVFVLKYEPIKFLIAQGRNDEAIKAIRQMYKYATDDEIALQYIDAIKSVSGKGSSGLTLKDALCNPQYRKATWVNIGQIIFHELTGVHIINQYSNIIFKNMQKSGRSSLTPRQGVYIIGLVIFLSSMFSLQTVKYVGRKTLLVYGHIGISLMHFGVAMFIKYNFDIGVILMILMFEIIFNNSSGPVTWLYASETTIDAGMGICILFLWGTVFFLSMVSPITLDPENVGPTPTFFTLSAISVFGSLYAKTFIKETFGQTDKEKKQIFAEKNVLNAKLLEE